jgi:hypothetical protein
MQNLDRCTVNVATQTMFVQCANGFSKEYTISTSAKGIGNQSGSYKTPLGKHNICEKIGDSAPLYTIFKDRQNTGIICEQINIPTEQDLILSRILRLKGTEPGVNSGTTTDGICIDSYERYIYIHGTNREDLLGTPASNGCIRMSNHDIVELFSNINEGADVDVINDKSTNMLITKRT